MSRASRARHRMTEAARDLKRRALAQKRIALATPPGTLNLYTPPPPSAVGMRASFPRCEHRLMTVHRDPGVTPMFLACRVEDCDGVLVSTGYQADYGDEVPTHEWYLPDLRELARLPGLEQDHIAQGGVLLRPIPTRKDPS